MTPQTAPVDSFPVLSSNEKVHMVYVCVLYAARVPYASFSGTKQSQEMPSNFAGRNAQEHVCIVDIPGP